MSYKIIAICGKAGSGKDTLLQEVLKLHPEYNEIISCTTRPPREGEVEGKNYYFLTNEQFAQKVLNGEMLEATIFNDWCYGTSIDGLDKDKINIGVFNPAGINALDENKDIYLITYQIEATDKERLLRQLYREENPNVHEIIRRFQADENDFMEFDYDTYILENHNGTDIVELAKQIWPR